MCGLVGYIGKNFSRDYVITGLTRLEYRGYDSAGFACLTSQENRLVYTRTIGQLKNLVASLEKNPINGYVGIGHTRWSTHGVASEQNAHPQFDCYKTLSLAHNGIIENYHALKTELVAKGHIFLSDTDTEVIAHLLEDILATEKTLSKAFSSLVSRLEGAYAIVCILQEFPDQLIAIRKGSPLCIGLGDNEMFVASDLLAFSSMARKVLFLPEKSFALVHKEAVELFDFSGAVLPQQIKEIDVNYAAVEKKGYEHFMLKEIYEQKGAIYSSLSFMRAISAQIWRQMGLTIDQVKNLESITLIGCGTSWYAARIGQFFFESVCKIPTRVVLASEFRYMPFFPSKNAVYIALSQSGETADTLEAIRLINALQLPTAVLTNVASSTMVREANGFLLTHAGQEVAVASTKAFSTQVAALFWLAHRIALEKGLIDDKAMELSEEELLIAAEVLENSIENYKEDILDLHARFYAQFKRFIFLGRHISYPFASEAALKLKEISYIFSQCYPAGELKHGPIALIDQETPVVLFSTLDPVIYQKLLSNAQEVKARKGHLVVFAFEGQAELIDLADNVFVFPRVHPLLAPLAMTGLMQYFAYQIARYLGCPIDMPRNLAKSVTVE